ncbi:4'-phosphopantetheinyl transferase [Hydrogenophaga sp. IBVHS1]|uniref:4'-phosphopantetheinyl transferase family protein n=1 Tax=unclassified Hydrogenophaga TaxID=2610897 RepID=UPI000A2EB9B5|nr:4'-phosphopantetheinyl transferase superfamily protein [Hydrogenophaga sp. IBVHS1]OSZ75431.1 hypothetical protein CAP37_08455 [Hydrogenophaga sp. IBVHS1]
MLAASTAAHQRLQATVQAQLGPELAVICTGVEGHPECLWPGERMAVAKAIPRRQREFAAGRAAARAAMRQLGWCECAIPAREDRSPTWPEGLVGSISHSAGFCVAVVATNRHWDSIGIDIESDQRVEPDLWPSICLPEELQQITHEDVLTTKSRVTRLFSAKEAFFKWQYPDTLRMLDFQDVEVRLNADGSSFEALCLREHRDDSRRCNATGQQFLLEGQILSLVVTEYPKNASKAALVS